PWHLFQTLSSVIWGIGLAAGLYLLVMAIAQKPERLGSWRFFSLSLALAVILVGLVLTLVGQEQLLDSFSSVIALLLSNIMVALAVGSIIRDGKMEHIRAQTELVTSYAVAPLGLFTLDAN